MKKNKMTSLADENVFQKIYYIREHKVLLDRDLAALYGIETRVLKQAVKRNLKRFPNDFMFILTPKEFQNLRSQNVTSSWGGDRYPPMAFTEQGVAMLSSVINSDRAIAINIQIMRVFVKMRQMIMSYKDLLLRIENLENDNMKTNEEIRNIYHLIKELLEPSVKNPGRIGFKIGEKQDN